MSAFDDAIAAHMAHPAGAMGDPLTDSWAEQQACTQPAQLPEQQPDGPVLRAGWENEPVRVPHHWPLYLLALIGSIVFFCLSGCSTVSPQQREPRPEVWASCPPLATPQTPNDIAYVLRIAELERWYTTCREAALAMPKQQDPLGFKGWR